MRRLVLALAALVIATTTALAQPPSPVNPLWHEQKIKNYLPHMTWPEVADLLTRTDMVILPIASLEQQAVTRYIVDRINQETAGIAVELGEAAAPFETRSTRKDPPEFDRHGGVNETSNSLYLTPNLVNMSVARTAPLTLLPHLQAMLPAVVAGDPTATRVFLAEALKSADTGKGTSTKDMTETGVWSVRDVKAATVERGREESEMLVTAAVAFIERWKQLRPLGAK